MAAKFQTPPTLPDGVVCRTLRIPSDKYWLGIFNSALLEMNNPYLWEQVNETDLTIDETIALIAPILQQYWETEGCETIPEFTATIETGTPIAVTYNPETFAFHFVIPPGEQGIQGIQGEQGIQGIQGIPGIQGIQGIPGVNADAPNTVLPDLTSDDKDEIFGGAMALVLHLEERVKDFLSALAIAANVIEAVSELVSAVPILNLLPFDEILQVMSDINGFGESAVNASLTPELREELACEMFCIIVANGGDIDTGTLESWRVENVDTLNPGQASIILMSYLLSDKEHFDRYFLGLNDLNPDWETLCDCVEPPPTPCEGVYSFDFIPNDAGWYPVSYPGNTALHVNSVGWKPNGGFMWIRGNFDSILPGAVEIHVTGTPVADGFYNHVWIAFSGFGSGQYVQVVDGIVSLNVSTVITSFDVYTSNSDCAITAICLGVS